MKRFDSEEGLELLTQYFSGDLDPCEREEVLHKLSKLNDGEAFLDVYLRGKDEVANYASLDEGEISNVAARAIRAIQGSVAEGDKSLTKLSNSKTSGKYGAKIYALALASVGVVVLMSLNLKDQFSITPAKVVEEDVIYTTRSGQQTTVSLPDGSMIHLGVGSELNVPHNYKDGNRKLALKGEAFFEVIHKSTSPFTVKSGDIETRVLGTKFSVRNFPEDSAVIVSVAEGRVESGTQILNALQRISFNTDGRIRRSVVQREDVEIATGILTVTDMPLSQSIPKLNRWYNIQLEVGDEEMNDWRLSGEFRRESTSSIQSMLELALGVRILSVGDKLVLYPRS